MQLEIQKYLFDVKTAVDSIFDFLGDKRDFFEFQKNRMLRRAVERELGIIGEAVGKILKIDPNFPIDNARKIIQLRNIVVHSYDQVDDVVIWGIVSVHLPRLRVQVEDLLKKE